MNCFVLLKMVPDPVEELEVAADGKSLDKDILRLKLADSDEHALEEAILLAERQGGTVTVVAFDAPEVDDVLFTALAKGANRAVKIAGDWADLQSVEAAEVMARFLAPGETLPPDALVMLRSQAIDDLEGEVGAYLADLLKVPYLGIVTSVNPEGGGVTVTKEFAGGLRGEFSLPLPAVLGIQSAEKPPRYVPIAKVRAAQKNKKIETADVEPPKRLTRLCLEKLSLPEVAGRAQMIEGTSEEVANKIMEVLVKENLVQEENDHG